MFKDVFRKFFSEISIENNRQIFLLILLIEHSQWKVSSMIDRWKDKATQVDYGILIEIDIDRFVIAVQDDR